MAIVVIPSAWVKCNHCGGAVDSIIIAGIQPPAYISSYRFVMSGEDIFTAWFQLNVPAVVRQDIPAGLYENRDLQCGRCEGRFEVSFSASLIRFLDVAEGAP